MDYKDFEAGATKLHFWFRAKNDLIHILMSGIGKKNLKILNVGAGRGDDLKVLNKFGSVYTIDIDKKALDAIPAGLCADKRLCDACSLSYPDNFFDIVVSFDVFEHISGDKAAISEIYRVLKKDCPLVFSVPAFQFLFSSHDRALRHKRRYSKKMLRKLLSNFYSVKLNYWNFLLFIPIALERMLKRNSNPKLKHHKLPGPINQLLFSMLKLENLLIKNNFKLPVGISIIGICKK